MNELLCEVRSLPIALDWTHLGMEMISAGLGYMVV